MAIDFTTSKTKENIMKAFAGESQARNRYTIAAEIAREQGMKAISDVFLFTADQERAHAERYYELLKDLEGTTIDICGGYPVDTYSSVIDLLGSAQHNEMEEYADVYPAFGDVAKREGFLEAASVFYQTAMVEQIHGRRFGKIREMLENNVWDQSRGEGEWMCTNCGHIHRGQRVPEICPLCRHEKGYFIPLELAPYMEKAFIK